MENEYNNDTQSEINIPQPPGIMPKPPKHTKPRSIWRVFGWFFFAVSVLINIGLFLAVIGIIGFLVVGTQGGIFAESVMQSGDRNSKIAVVNLTGIINNQTAHKVHDQIKMAQNDKAVKGLILRVNSPGGAVSSSDQIYNDIKLFREKTGKPVMAFMQGMAASGGYYASAACEQIMAEPTVITGSIGVIMSHFVLGDLLKNKLGVVPIVVKSGEKKDWPSSYRIPSAKQIEYLQNHLIKPAYERFLKIVTESRKDYLSAEQVRSLADGSIYSAQEARDNMLIDRIGYLDDAIDFMETMANITDAHVIEYKEPFKLKDIMGAQTQTSILNLNRNTVHKLCTPEIMYLWR